MLADSKAARAEEEARKARIKDGSARIDTNFAGFDQQFFDGIANNQMNLYQPELDDQFGKARDSLAFALARAGTLNSTIAGDKTAELGQKYDTQKATIASNAQAAADALKGRVATEKTSLTGLLNSTADSDRAANESLARSQQLFQEQPTYNALPDLFAGFASGVGNYYAGQQSRDAYAAYTNSRSPSAGSSRTIQ